MTKNQASLTIIITGMHRSGTSCLAGSLQQKGLYLGEVYEWSKYNLKGNREKKAVMDLNESILIASGGSWDSLPENIEWTDEEIEKRDEIITSFTSEPKKVWGFKDPRALLTLPFWQEGLDHIQLVASLRHPLLVAQSLHKRAVALGYGDKMTVGCGLDLWAVYNQQLLAYVKDEPFPIISFDQTLPEYLLCIDTICKKLGLVGVSQSDEDNFIEPSLINQTIDSSSTNQVPRDIMKLYDELKGFCL